MLLTVPGSPNGQGCAYFLLQHKPQLGGARFIWKIRIFRRDDDDFAAPILLFYVDKGEHQKSTNPATNPAERAKIGYKSRVVKRRAGDGSFVREHIFRSKIQGGV